MFHFRDLRPLLLSLLLGTLGAADEETARKLLADGIKAFERKDYEKADSLAYGALEEFPGLPEAQLLHGRANLELGKFERAYDSLRGAVDGYADKPEGKDARAWFHRAALGWIAAMDQSLSRIDRKKERGDYEDTLLQKAKALVAIGDTEPALRALADLVTYEGTSIQCRRAEVYLDLGKTELAIADYRRFFARGDEYSKDTRAARDLLRLTKGSSDDETRIADCTAILGANNIDEVYLERAQAQLRRKQAARAVADYRILVKKNRDSDYYRKLLDELEETPGLKLAAEAVLLFEEAKQAYAARRFVAAKERCETALALNPALHSAKVLIARSYHAGRYPSEYAIGILVEAREASGGKDAEVAAALRELSAEYATKTAKDLESEKQGDNQLYADMVRKLIGLQVHAGQHEAALATSDRFAAIGRPWIGYELRAQIHDLRGETDLAIQAYRSAVGDRSPDYFDCFKLLRDLLLRKNDHPGIVDDMTRTLKAHPGNRIALRWRTESLEILGRHPEALADLGELIRDMHWDASLRLRRFTLARKTGDFAQMQADCAWLVRQQAPGYAAAVAELTREAQRRKLLQSGQGALDGDALGKEGGAVVAKALQQVLLYDDADATLLEHPDVLECREPMLHYAVARYFARTAAPSRAAQHFARAVELAEGAIDPHRVDEIAEALGRCSPLSLEIHKQRVSFLEDLSRRFPASRAAAEALTAARADTPRVTEYDRLRRKAEADYDAFKSCWKSAEEAERRKDFPAALKAYDSALEKVPGDDATRLRQARVHLQAKNATAARNVIRAFLARAGNGTLQTGLEQARVEEQTRSLFVSETYSTPAAAACVARAFTYAGQAFVAMRLLEASLQEFPDDPDLLLARGEARLEQVSGASVRAADADFQRGMELKPGDARFHAARAMTVGFLGDSAGAMNHLNKAIELDPKNASYYYQRAERRRRMEGTDEEHLYRKVMKDVRQSLALRQTVDAWQLLGTLYESRGEHLEGIKCGQRMHALDPRIPAPDIPEVIAELAEKFRQANLRGQAEWEAKQARERDARRKADEAAERERLAAAARKPPEKDWLDRLSEAFRQAGPAPGGAFDRMVEGNRAGGAELQRRMNEESARNARTHEIERRFGYYSGAAQSARERR